MNKIIKFENKEIEIISHDRSEYISLSQIERALEMNGKNGVHNIYARHKEEFTDGMTALIRKGSTTIRIFNREGCWLIGMFARTEKAKAFRKWVLAALGNHVDGKTSCPTGSTLVKSHCRKVTRSKSDIEAENEQLKKLLFELKPLREEDDKPSDKAQKTITALIEYGKEQFNLGLWEGMLKGARSPEMIAIMAKAVPVKQVARA